ncbi:hypothetical protein JMJ35_001050 [Cladonia borealis]|uniref:Uncharacterized protein n=1 Tax=Cladonia borealis TaxID=184061 RepID=A0AA39V539_9LECA|nr:hypothetical protein JMJ35_001050 [Cladonia borealis]
MVVVVVVVIMPRNRRSPPIAGRRSNAALADFFNDTTLSPLGWAVGRSLVAASVEGTDAEWVLKPSYGDDNDIVVKVFLTPGGLREATIAFGTHLGTYSRALDSFFQPPAHPRGVHGQLNLESVGVGNGEESSNLILLWVYGNVFVRIAHQFGGPHRDWLHVRELADKLQKCISEGSKPLDANNVMVPKIRKLSGPKDPGFVGEAFVVHVSLESKSHTTVDCKVGANPRILPAFCVLC